MKIRALIVDDEHNACMNLKILLDDFCDEVEVIGTAMSVSQARELIEIENPELVFLDIAMPNEDGFALLNHYEGRDFSVVFTTAHDNHALRAFKADAVDYLEKPINIEELRNAVAKVILIRSAITNTEQSGKKNDRISIPTKSGYAVLRNEDIVHLQASDNYTMIYLADGSRHMSSKNIKVYEENLNSSIFFRTHKSYIINVEHHLKEFSRGEGNMAVLKNGKMVPVARRKVSGFLNRINTF